MKTMVRIQGRNGSCKLVKRQVKTLVKDFDGLISRNNAQCKSHRAAKLAQHVSLKTLKASSSLHLQAWRACLFSQQPLLLHWGLVLLRKRPKPAITSLPTKKP
jgi:hypothetical protein